MGSAAILPVITDDLYISPRFTPYEFYRDASSALSQLINHWLSFTHVPTLSATDARIKILLTRIELATSALAGVQVGYLQ